MKNINITKLVFVILIGLLLTSLSTYSQIPKTISYQGVLTDTSNNPLPDGNYNLTFKLYDVETGGTPLWAEAQLVFVSKGIFNVILGSISPLNLSFDKLYYLGITVGGGGELTPRIQLTSSSYSMRSIRTDSINGINAGGNLTGTYPNPSIANNAVTSANILDGAIQRVDVATDFKAPYADTADAARTSAPSGNAGGDLTGTYPNPSIANNAVTSAKIIDGTIQRVDVATDFKAPYADTADVARTSAPSGSAGGDLTGTYPNPTIANSAVNSAKILNGSITGLDISSTAELNIASLTTTGNVGIGTASPDRLLDIAGNFAEIRFRDLDNGVEGRLSAFGAGFVDLRSFTNHPLTFATNDTERMWITETGNIGIGTGSPNEQLEITGNLRLPPSTTSVGVIKSGPDRFIHNFGSNNFFAGLNAGNLTMTGSGGNTGVGVGALFSNTTGYSNTANGMSALYSNTTGFYNTASGLYALYSNTGGHSNTANGSGALLFNTLGNYNTASGRDALYSNTTGNNNTANGLFALYYNTEGHSNTADGSGALYSNTTGIANTASGRDALFSNTTGNFNTALGFNAGYAITTGSNNIAIGYDAQVPTPTASNQIRLGNTSITYAGIQVAWTVTSDRRYKENIQPLNLGLGFISKLNPVSYHRKTDDKQKTEYGLIAQEVEQVLKEYGIENTGMLTITDEGMYELRYNDLLAPMIKAIQELNKNNIELRSQNKELVTKNQELAERLSTLEEMMKAFVENQSTENKSLGELQMTNDK